MSFIDKLKRAVKAFITEQDLASATVRVSDVASEGRYFQQTAKELMARYSGTAAVCAGITARSVAQLPVRVMRIGGGKPKGTEKPVKSTERRRIARNAGRFVKRAMAESDDEAVEITDINHPVLSLLTNANPYQNWFELCENLCMYLGPIGNAYMPVVKGTNGLPAAIYSLPAQFVRALPTAQPGNVGAYVYGTGTEVEQTYDAANVIHFRTPNPTGDPYYGMGWFAQCVLAMDTERAILEHQNGHIRNGAMPNLSINDPNLDPDERLRIETELNRKYQGPAKSGRTLVSTLSAEAKITMLSPPQGAEMSFGKSREQCRDVIANAAGTPIALLTMDTASLAQAQEAMPQYHAITIRPMAKRIEDKLNEQLLPMFGAMGQGLMIVIDDPEDRRDPIKDTTTNALYQGGMLKLNEGRARIGEEAVPGGDKFIHEINPPEPAGGFADVDGTEDKADKPDDKDAKRSIEPEPPPPLKFLASTFSECACSTAGHAHHAVVRAVDPEAVVDVHASGMEAALRRFFSALSNAVQEAINVDAGTVSLDLSGDGIAQLLAEALAPKQRDAFLAAYNEAAQAIGMQSGGTTQMASSLSEKAQEYLLGRRSKMLPSIAETISERVSDALQSSINAGGSMADHSEAVAKAFGKYADAASTAIAQTEATKAYSGGREAGWIDSGLVEAKEWLLSGNPCQFCEALEGKIVPLGEPFVPLGGTVIGTKGGVLVCDYEEIQHPALHPNCACTIGAVFKDESKEGDK